MNADLRFVPTQAEAEALARHGEPSRSPEYVAIRDGRQVAEESLKALADFYEPAPGLNRIVAAGRYNATRSRLRSTCDAHPTANEYAPWSPASRRKRPGCRSSTRMPDADWPGILPDVLLALEAEGCLPAETRCKRRGAEVRYGRHGSLSVNRTRATFRDHEAGCGGGLLALVAHVGGGDEQDAARRLRGSWRHREPLSASVSRLRAD